MQTVHIILIGQIGVIGIMTHRLRLLAIVKPRIDSFMDHVHIVGVEFRETIPCLGIHVLYQIRTLAHMRPASTIFRKARAKSSFP